MAFPKFIYETVGTALFVITSSSAIASASGDGEKALYYALSWALMHTTFKTHSQAFFNPVLTLGDYVIKGLDDTADMIMTIVGQILGSMIGVSVMGALTDNAVSFPDVALTGSNMAANLTIETLAVAALVFLFFGKPAKDITPCLWSIFVLFVMTTVAGNRMNPARYMNDILSGAMNSESTWAGPTEDDVAVMVGSILGALGGALLRNYND